VALSERSRTTIYQSLEPLLGEEAVGEMLSYFPARDVEEPATKEFVAAEVARLEGKLDAGLAGLDAKMASLRAEMHKEFRAMVVWLVMAMVAIASAVGLVAR
jgi:DNA-binding transcriptional regulator LsrR (DeoR family)